MTQLSPNVAAAIANAATTQVDHRGLMPLPEARALVASVSAFHKGAGQFVGDRFVTGSDRLWAALLSLEDAEEFVREACRLRWMFHPRGRGNTAPLDRYGNGIVNWLAGFVRADGLLIDIPWCVSACLIEMGDRIAFGHLLRVTDVYDGVVLGVPGPFASDGPGHYTAPQTAAPSAATAAADRLILDAAARHPGLALTVLAERVYMGDARGQRLFAQVVTTDSKSAWDQIVASRGEDQARHLFEKVGVALPAGVHFEDDTDDDDDDESFLERRLRRQAEKAGGKLIDKGTKAVGNAISGVITSIVIGICAIGVVGCLVCGVGGYVTYAILGGPSASPTLADTTPRLASWDGKSTLKCGGNDRIKVSGVTATIKGIGVDAAGNCQVELVGVTLSADTALRARGNASITVVGGTVTGRTLAVDAGAASEVDLTQATVQGEVKKSGLAKVRS